MCGIYGWQLNDSVPPEKRAILAAALTVHMDRRGGDSWGYYAPLTAELNRGLDDLASSVTAQDLAKHPSIMAHTRFATVGDTTIANCHPFDLPSLVGAHNGQITNHYQLNKTHSRNCAVDSEHIFRHLDENLDTEDIHAYGAIEYVYKDAPGCVYLGIFNGGELAIAQIEGGGIIWASTRKALDDALQLAGLDGAFYDLADNYLYSADNYQLWKNGPLMFGSYHRLGQVQFVPAVVDNFDNEVEWDIYDKDMESYLDDDMGGHWRKEKSFDS